MDDIRIAIDSGIAASVPASTIFDICLERDIISQGTAISYLTRSKRIL